jgi:hypothetical protein
MDEEQALIAEEDILDITGQERPYINNNQIH